MTDFKALQSLKDVEKNIKSLDKPPDNFSPQKTGKYSEKCKKMMAKTRDTISKVTSYIEAVNDKLTDILKSLHHLNKTIEESMTKALETIRKQQYSLEKQEKADVGITRGGRSGQMSIVLYSITSNQPVGQQTQGNHSNIKNLMILQNLAKEHVLLQEFIAKSQEVCGKTDISDADLNALEERLFKWKDQADLAFKSEHEMKKVVERRKRGEEERERQNDLDKLTANQQDNGGSVKQPDPEVQEDKVVENIEEPAEVDEVEDLMEDYIDDDCDDDDDVDDDNSDDQDENDDKFQNQEEKNSQIEEEKGRLREEEEKRMKELEENKKREEEKERKRQMLLQEEEERKRLEEEKRRKEEEYRKQLEEERRKHLDPRNWGFIVYRLKSDEVGGMQQNYNSTGFSEVSGKRYEKSDVCCVISAPDGNIRKADIRCTFFGVECTDFDNPTEDDERLVSPIVYLQSERGEIKTEAPTQVFLPHIYVNNEDDETVLKCSENGNEWISFPPIKPVKLVRELNKIQNDNITGMEVPFFTNLRVVVVRREKRKRITVGEVGGRELLSSDDDDGIINVVIPRGTFKAETVLEAKIQSVPKEAADSVLKKGEKVTRIILIYCSQPPNKSLTLDVERQIMDSTTTKNVQYTTIKTGDTWKFADAEMKENTNSIELPLQKRKYSVIEVDMPQDIQSDQALHIAAAIHTRINSIPVKMILKQNLDDPHDAIIQCVHSALEENVLQNLLVVGYSMGPDVSCELFIQEGSKIDISCFGNVQFIKEQKIGLVFLADMNSASRRVKLEAINKYFEREYSCYSGGVIYKFSRGRSLDGLSDMMSTIRHTIVLPKVDIELQRTVRNLASEMIGLAKFLSILLTDNCPGWHVVQTNMFGASKDITMKAAPIKEDGTEAWSDQELCRRIIVDWMNSKTKFNRLAHIRNVLVSSGYPQLAAPCTDFVNYFKDTLNDAMIDSIILLIKMDPVEVSERLGLSDDEVNNIFMEFHDESRSKTAALIYGWRFTENAIKAGLRACDVLKSSLGI